MRFRELSSSSFRLVEAAALAGLVALIFLVYWPGLGSGFWFDDLHVVQENKSIRISCLCFDQLKAAAYSFLTGTRQVSMLSFALNHYFFGNSAGWYKVINIALHSLTMLLLFPLTKLLLASVLTAKNDLVQSESNAMRWVPLVTVAWWGLHPINMSPVLYISQRMAILAALFTILGLILYCLARRDRSGSRLKVALLYLGVLICAGLAYLSKENGILIFAYIFVLEITIFRFRNGAGKTVFWYLGVLALGAALSIGVVLFDVFTGSNIVVGGYGRRTFSLEERAMTEARALWFYIRLILIPDITKYGIWHDDFVLSTGLLHPPTTMLAILGLAGLFFSAIALTKKHPLIALGIFWFFASHSLESTVFPLELVHEHRNYLAAYGVLLCVSIGLIQALQIRPSIKALGVLMLAASLALSTYARASRWSNPLMMALNEALNHPKSARSQYELGKTQATLATRGFTELVPAALENFQKARLLDEYTIIPEISLALTSEVFNGTYESEWFDAAAEKYRKYPAQPGSIIAIRRLYECVEREKCDFDRKDTETLFQAAEEAGDVRALSIAGFYYANVVHDYVRAEKILRSAIRKAPNNIVHRINYISLLLALGRKEEAAVQLRHVLSANDYRANVHAGRIEDYKRQLEDELAQGLN